MKVFGLNGREYNLDLKRYTTKRSKCSYYHNTARDLLHNVFAGYNIYEEVKLPGSVDPSKKSVLYLDFFIPNVNMAIEVQGEQHFKYIPFFHKSKIDFLKAQARDRNKLAWCELNGICLVELKWDDSIEYWRNKIERSR